MRFIWIPFVAASLMAQDDARRIAMGEAMLKTEPTVEGVPELTAYLDALALRMAPHVEGAPKWSWTTKISRGDYKEPRLNPDGTIVLPVRILREAKSEAEMAGLLAHMIAHHPFAKPVRVKEGMSLIYWSGDMIPPALVPRFRAMEQQADTDTVAALRSAGYDPTAWNDLYLRLKLDRAMDAGRDPKVEPPGGDSVVDTADFQAFRVDLAASLPLPPKVRPPSLRNARVRMPTSPAER